MTPVLTDEQRQALHDANDRGPVTIVDPATNARYILMTVELYDRCRALFPDDPFDVREAYGLMDDVARREGWLDDITAHLTRYNVATSENGERLRRCTGCRKMLSFSA